MLTSRDDELDTPTRALSTLSMWLYGSETQVRLKSPCAQSDRSQGAETHMTHWLHNAGGRSRTQLVFRFAEQVISHATGGWRWVKHEDTGNEKKYSLPFRDNHFLYMSTLPAFQWKVIATKHCGHATSVSP